VPANGSGAAWRFRYLCPSQKRQLFFPVAAFSRCHGHVSFSLDSTQSDPVSEGSGVSNPSMPVSLHPPARSSAGRVPSPDPARNPQGNPYALQAWRAFRWGRHRHTAATEFLFSRLRAVWEPGPEKQHGLLLGMPREKRPGSQSWREVPDHWWRAHKIPTDCAGRIMMLSCQALRAGTRPDVARFLLLFPASDQQRIELARRRERRPC